MPRKIEEKTRVIRELLDRDSGLTWDKAESLLNNLGYSKDSRRAEYRITENDFNVRKHFYLKPKGKVNPKEKTIKKSQELASDIQISEAIDYVNRNGGIQSLNNRLQKLQTENEVWQNKIDSNNEKRIQIIAMVQIFHSVSKAISQAS